MPAERWSMRVREVLRLRYACGVSARVISQSLGIGRHGGRRVTLRHRVDQKGRDTR